MPAQPNKGFFGWLSRFIRDEFISRIGGGIVLLVTGTGGVTAIAAYLQRLPVAESITLVMLSSAGVAMAMNQTRRFLSEARISDKFQLFDIQLSHVLSPDGEKVIGYQPYLLLRNNCDTTIEYNIDDVNGDIEGLHLPLLPPAASVGKVLPYQEGQHMLFGVNFMPSKERAHIGGALRITYSFGRRREALKHTVVGRFQMTAVVDEFGNVLNTRTIYRE